MSLIKIASLLKNDLSLVDAKIKSSLENNNNQFAQDLIDYLLASSGKKIRPILTLLSFTLLTQFHQTNKGSKLLLSLLLKLFIWQVWFMMM